MLVLAGEGGGRGRGRKLEDLEKNPWSKDENQQQTQPTCDTRSWNRTQATVVEGKCSHYCIIPFNHTIMCLNGMERACGELVFLEPDYWR